MKKHSFVPSLDGRLEDRVVMSHAGAAGIVVNVPGVGESFVPNSAILTTRAYHNILTGVHRSLTTFERSNGTGADYNRLSQDVGRQINRLPYAQQEGLTDYVTGSLPYYAPSEAKIAYGDLRSTVVSYLSYEVLSGRAAIRKTPGHFFSDSDVYGPNALIFNGGGDNGDGGGDNGGGDNGGGDNGGGDNGNGNGGTALVAANGNGVSSAATLTTRGYNSILTNVHRSLVNFGRTQGTNADYNRLSQDVGNQINRLPYAQQNGLTDYVTGALPYYAPSEAKIAYGDLRSTIVSYLGTEVSGGYVAIRRSPGHFFSDSDIYGPNALIYNQAPPQDA
jgi:hypothetical protein